MTKLINLTKNQINIYNEANECVCTLAPSGNVVRVKPAEHTLFSCIDQKIPVYWKWEKNPIGLPEPSESTYYIVTEDIKRTVSHRADVLTVGEPLYDNYGNHYGYRGLSHFAYHEVNEPSVESNLPLVNPSYEVTAVYIGANDYEEVGEEVLLTTNSYEEADAFIGSFSDHTYIPNEKFDRDAVGMSFEVHEMRLNTVGEPFVAGTPLTAYFYDNPKYKGTCKGCPNLGYNFDADEVCIAPDGKCIRGDVRQ